IRFAQAGRTIFGFTSRMRRPRPCLRVLLHRPPPGGSVAGGQHRRAEIRPELRPGTAVDAESEQPGDDGVGDGRRSSMSDHVYKIVEIVGSSAVGIEDAIQRAIDRASKTVREIRWFEVIST